MDGTDGSDGSAIKPGNANKQKTTAKRMWLMSSQGHTSWFINTNYKLIFCLDYCFAFQQPAWSRSVGSGVTEPCRILFNVQHLHWYHWSIQHRWIQFLVGVSCGVSPASSLASTSVTSFSRSQWGKPPQLDRFTWTKKKLFLTFLFLFGDVQKDNLEWTYFYAM